jgi:DNA-damage-inducible protein J
MERRAFFAGSDWALKGEGVNAVRLTEKTTRPMVCGNNVATYLEAFPMAILKTTDVRCRIEEDLKVSATEILKSCGLSLSEAMRLFLRQVVSTQGLPFEVRLPSEKTARAMAQAREIKNRFDSVDDMLRDVDAEDRQQAKAGRSA